VTPVLLLLWTLSAGATQDRPASSCATWQECRTLALEAAEQRDYETFHDLAWRAVQRGPRNDPSLMTMLARAQSLSGRPGDALVMLRRLADLGVVTEAQTSEDFRRVRALAAWPELEARLSEIAAGKPAVAASEAGSRAPGTTAAKPPRAPELEAGVETAAPPPAGKPADPSARSTAPPAGASPAGGDTAEEAAGGAVEALRFTSEAFGVAGLAYDAVSNRFIIGDRREQRLAVIGERSQRVSTLTGAASAGFGEIVALEIDRHEGDLWVGTVASGGAQPASRLHKLQLISGRQLFTIPAPEDAGPVRFADVTLTPSSSVLALDSEGARVFRAAPRSRVLELAARVDVEGAASIAAASDTVAYIAHPRGLMRVDLSAGGTRAVSAAKGVDLAGLAWIRWHRDSIVAVQPTSGAQYRIVRIAFDASGRRARRVTVLDRDVPLAGPFAASLNGDAIYYLVGSGDGAERVVRKMKVR
jgi:hypothetical protein